MSLSYTEVKNDKKPKKYNDISVIDVLKVFWVSVRKQQLLFIGICVAVAGTAIVEGVITPLYYKKFFDILAANSATPTTVIGLLFGVLWMIFGLNITKWIGWRLSTWGSTYFQTAIMSDLAERAFEYLLGHSYGFFSNSFTGALSQKVRRFSRSSERISDRLFYEIIPIGVKVVGILYVLMATQKSLAYAIGIWIVVLVGFSWFAAKIKVRHGNAVAEADTKVTGTMSDILGNHSVVQLFNTTKIEFKRFSDVIRHLQRLTIKKWNIDMIIDSTQSLSNTIIEFVIFWIILSNWGLGLVSVGVFVLVQMYIIRLADDLWRSSRVIRDLYEAFSDAREMVEIMQKPHDIQDMVGATALTVPTGSVHFENVCFAFHKDKQVLKGINLDIKPAERIALIGPSGAGKSTLVRLLLRLYDIQSGSIRIDGQSINQVTQGSLREAISFVPQDPILFHRTLKENIRYGKESATDEEVVHAAKLAHCDEFISSFPNGYDTYVGERGVKLSGGERQRVAIARAILKNAPLLILDEATSSLDSHSESLIQDAMETLMKGKTVIVIAHRLSTIRQMDRIVVVNHGVITEEGDHQNLLEKKGLYAKLWSLQSGGFLKDVSEDEAVEA